MKKEDLLRQIALTGYNIGYAATKHLATYDLAEKASGLSSFLTFSVGLFFLLLDFAAKKYFSVACTILGMIGLRASMWDHKKGDYAKAGEELTGQLNSAKILYYRVKAKQGMDLSAHEASRIELQNKYINAGISSQMMFSDWYAHYKVFWQQQIDWTDGELKFRRWRDKVPLSFSASVVIIVVITIAVTIARYVR